jgi:muramoyltetrapeptide carboxypeptidase
MATNYGRNLRPREPRRPRKGKCDGVSTFTLLAVCLLSFMAGLFAEPALSGVWSVSRSVEAPALTGNSSDEATAHEVATAQPVGAQETPPAEATAPAEPGPTPTPSWAIDAPRRTVYWPARLTSGDTISVVATGSAVKTNQLERGMTALGSLGFVVEPAKNVRANSGGRAGTAAQRAQDFNRAIADASVDAIWCARGGSGSIDLLSLINWEVYSQKAAKPFIGYSDVTVLQLALYAARGIISFSGPMVAEDHGFGGPVTFRPETQAALMDWLRQPEQTREIRNLWGNAVRTHRPGTASGPLLGGNLSRVVTIVNRGGRYCPDFKGSVLVLEDINEGEASVRSMIGQLEGAGVLAKVNGVIFGDLDVSPDEVALNAMERALGDRDVPIAYGLDYGHLDEPRVTVPIGAWTTLDAGPKTATITVHSERPQPLRAQGAPEGSGE